ncbi:MAG TPA: helix-turn-helix domain-containing protein [Ktedonobacteraceae bacterium]
MNRKYLRVQDLVDETGLGEETIRSYIRKKQLSAIRMGRDYLIDPADWERFKAERRTDRPDDEKPNA